MELIGIVVLISTLFCSLVAGLVLTFAIVVMPGLQTMSDVEYLKSFKAIDRVIQNNQTIFMLVWIGSVVALVITTFLGLTILEGTEQLILLCACGIYLFGVQLPTFVFNIPLNNRLQSQDIDAMTQETRLDIKNKFETTWRRSNATRTILSILTSVLLLIVLLRL